MYQSTNMLQQLSISKSDDGYKIDVKMQIIHLSRIILSFVNGYWKLSNNHF